MWSVMEPLMPTVSGRSRPWTDHRLAIEGMAWKYRTGAPWRDVPERFGKWNSIYKRFSRWAEDGTWEKLLAEVQKQADAAGKIDWVVSIDSTIARVHQHGATLNRDTGGSWVQWIPWGREGSRIQRTRVKLYSIAIAYECLLEALTVCLHTCAHLY